MRFAPPIFVTFVLIALAGAAPPPGIMVAKDRPDDAGDALIVEWTLPEGMEPTGYRIQARPVRKGITRPDGKPWTDFVLLAEPAPGDTTAVIDGLTADERFEVQIEAVDADGVVLWAASSGVVAPKVNWFNLSRAWLAILLGVVCGAVLVYITAARRGMKLWVRPIAGLQAVTDAVGRAVEMGKSVLFVPGLLDINDIQTVAGITILSRVARIAAEYDAEIKVPTARSLVMATARETVEASFLHAGRPDSYNADDVYYLTDEQFGFVAGVTGPMLREKPAACFYMGAFRRVADPCRDRQRHRLDPGRRHGHAVAVAIFHRRLRLHAHRRRVLCSQRVSQRRAAAAWQSEGAGLRQGDVRGVDPGGMPAGNDRVAVGQSPGRC